MPKQQEMNKNSLNINLSDMFLVSKNLSSNIYDCKTKVII